MTRLHCILLVLGLSLSLPSAHAGEAQADRRRRVEQAQRIEQRLPGAAVDLRMIGFVDRDPTRNCDDPVDGALPCVESVDYAAPPDAGLVAAKGRARLFDEPQQALVGRLLFWGLTDLAYRSSSPPSAATVSVDRGLWERGAVRLPSAESLWRGVERRPRRRALWSASTAAPEPWFWSGDASQSLCVPLQYQGAHAEGTLSQGPTRPEALVCADGFVANFVDALGNHFPGQLFRMGRVEGGSRTRRTAAPDKGEQLLTEYLFLSGGHDAAPWSTQQRRDGTRRGIFRLARVLTPSGTELEELFVDPVALAGGSGGRSLDVAPADVEQWTEALASTDLPAALDLAIERFIDRIGIRILGHATLEFNPTHVRTLTALASLREPPPSVINAEDTAPLVLGPNPGHRDRSSVGGAGDEDEQDEDEVWSGSSLSGDIGAQTRKLPNDLRWLWIERLLLRHALASVPGSGLPEAFVRLDRCQVPDCPNYDVAPPEDDVRFRAHRAWRDLEQLLLERNATLTPDELAQGVRTLRTALTADEAADASAQLLEILFEGSRVHPGRLLLDHILTELSTTLNAGTSWESAALETEATAVFSQILADHGYPTVPLGSRGEPANPLAVCDEPGGEDSGVHVIELDVLFEAPAGLATLAPGEPGDERAAATRRAAWAALREAATDLPFVAVDAPGRNPPEVTPVFLLPADSEGHPRAVYRARWRVWSGWHLFWGVTAERFAFGAGAVDGSFVDGEGLVLRSGALCHDTTLVAADLEPTLVRAALLRGFAPAIPPAPRPPGAPPPPDSAEGAVDGAGEGVDKANDAAGKAAELANTNPTDLAASASGGGIADLFAQEPPDEEASDEGASTPAGQVRAMLIRRLQNHPRLSCPSHRDAGTRRDDADLDGASELFGDCDDASPTFVPSQRPELYLVLDLHEGRIRTPPGPARSPYLTLSGPRLSGSVYAVSTVRDPDGESTARHVLPDHRPIVQKEGRWARRSTGELTLGFEAGWAPLDLLGARCDADYDGPPSVTCVRDGDNVLVNRDRLFEDVSRVGVHAGMQVLATIWDSNFQRTGFDAGVELGLNVTLPGVWGPSTLQRIALIRPRVAGVFGFRALLLPALRQPGGIAPWGAADRFGGARFARAVMALRTGWSITTLPGSIEGGPLLEFTLGPAVRSRAGRFAALTPYRPRAVLSGFVRGDAAFLLETLEHRLTQLEYRVTATFGVHGTFSVGAKLAREPKAPDISGFKALGDLATNPPTLPGAP